MAYSSIIKPSDYFNTKLYTGDASSSNAITGVGFEPSLTWLKGRNIAESNRLYDAVRGASNYITSNSTGAQSNSIPLTSFNADGFTIGTNDDSVNGSYNYVSWNWLANGAGSSNTDGSITSTVSANTTSKCSIVKWVGTGANATVGHGLGVVPSTVWVKNLDTTDSWMIWHKGLAGTHYLAFNTTAGDANGGSGPWNSTIPDANVFSLGNYNETNKASSNMIAYVFADVQGYSKINRYSGNGNADGSFIYTGHKPAFVMIKCASHPSTDWVIYDNKRSGYNGDNRLVYPNLSNAEEAGSALPIDILSNGFKPRTTANLINANGYNYFYWSFAGSPFVANSGESIPTTAR